MKLLAHSLVPTSPTPYMHLGYLSATSTGDPEASIKAFGPLVIAIIGVYLLLNYRRRSAMVWLGSVMAVGGFAASISIYLILSNGPLRYLSPYQATLGRERVILEGIKQSQLNDKAIPTTLTAFQKEWALPDSNFEDGWFHRIRYSQEVKEKQKCYVITSAGPDGRFGTPDDLCSWLRSDGIIKSDYPRREQK